MERKPKSKPNSNPSSSNNINNINNNNNNILNNNSKNNATQSDKDKIKNRKEERGNIINESAGKKEKSKSTYYISSWVFIRLMGVLYVTMFISNWVQIHGLIGSEGISPMGEYIKRLWMTAAAASTSSSLTSVSTYSFFTHLSYLLSHPTVFWANHSDLMIHFVCAIGVLSGIMITLDILPFLSSFLCWLLYISIVNVGQSFFNHQWDLLLCESGFLLMIMVKWHWEMQPMKRSPRDYHPPSPSLWLYRLLLFRVNFGRGMMGLMGKEKSWRILTSFLTYFPNQPSPTPMAWYGDKIPSVMLQGMGFWIMTVEIAFSILIAAPQLLRRSAAIYLLLLHLFFILTSNQSSYHWNLILLSFLLLDDQFYPHSLTSFLRRIRSRSIRSSSSSSIRSPSPSSSSSSSSSSIGKEEGRRGAEAGKYQRRGAMLIAVCVVIMTTVPLSALSQGNLTSPPLLVDLYKHIYPYHLINIYSPFPRLPKERIGIVIQGSKDAQTWRDYSFLYSPNLPSSSLPSSTSSSSYLSSSAPSFVSPHISRLEYALWSAAQSDYHQEIWISRLLHRVLEDSPGVVGLFKKEPFAEAPDYIRAVRYRFSFTDFHSSTNTSDPYHLQGEWWKAEFVDIYTPTFSQTVHSLSSRRKNLRSRSN